MLLSRDVRRRRVIGICKDIMAFTAGVRWEGTGVRVAVIRQNVGGTVKLPNSSPNRNHLFEAGGEFSGGGCFESHRQIARP